MSIAFFAVALAAIFATWYKSEKTLSIHSIHTLRREIFYWAAVMTTFALGTAAGDMAAVTLHPGSLFATGAALLSSDETGAGWSLPRFCWRHGSTPPRCTPGLAMTRSDARELSANLCRNRHRCCAVLC